LKEHQIKNREKETSREKDREVLFQGEFVVCFLDFRRISTLSNPADKNKIENQEN
jgi:hypothetical protein